MAMGLTLLVMGIIAYCNGITALVMTPPLRPAPLPATDAERFGLGVIHGTEADAFRQVASAWYLNWLPAPEYPQVGATFWPMVRVHKDGSFTPSGAALEAAVIAMPGHTWIIGNEPDISIQDNTSPEAFAQAYHAAYDTIRDADATARVAIGAVGAVTPLRLAYLDAVLLAYQVRYGHPLPTDVWTIHLYLLPERADSWGIGIPVGFDVQQGNRITAAQHAELSLFRRSVDAMRWWMAHRGYRDVSLVVTEFGILLPESFGFAPDVSADFLQDAVRYLLQARDAHTGYARDDDRLVQQFAWFALKDTLFETGTLIDLTTDEPTPAGERWQALYVEAANAPD